METNNFDMDKLVPMLTEALSARDVKVVFRKKDGTIREMHCTTNQTRIPSEKIPSKEAPHSDVAKRVFDIEKGEWRSFRWDSIIKWI